VGLRSRRTHRGGLTVAHDPRDVPAGFTDTAVIAEGATATVLRARDRITGQPVALKLLRDGDDRITRGTDAGDAAPVGVRALSALGQHPNVVTLHRVERTPEGRTLLVLELCTGSLADGPRAAAPSSPQHAVAVAVALAGAIETAHRAGIVHGDLRPEHVLVTRYGEVVLTGFASGAAPDAVTVADDVHGLATTLAALLGGGLEATGDVASDVPTPLADLLRTALSDVPAERIRTPLELVHRLHEVERECGWDPSPCRIGGVDRLTSEPDPGARRGGRAAAVTGLPPLGLRSLDPGPGRRR
jgi:eukaryotic-like serine/threonine-protein kinase